MFDPNVFNDSKQVLNDCFGSEKLFIIFVSKKRKKEGEKT